MNNWNFMKDTTKKPFNPAKMQCVKCKDIIWSKHPGEWVQCKCGKSYVDQTRYYMRVGGEMICVEEGTENE